MAVAAAALIAFSAAAHGRRMPLERLPDDKLTALAPLLTHGDLALIESAPDGTMKQVTLLLYVAAPPALVHEVIAHPGDYQKFVRNVSKSVWRPRDGGGTYSWKIDLPVSSFELTNDYDFEAGPTGAVGVTSPAANDDATLRWEFLPAAGGGTVLVLYGYSDIKHSSSLVRSFLKRMPVTEHGLAMAGELLMARNMKLEAERRVKPGTVGAVDLAAKGPGFGFLLDRGQVIVLRSSLDGRLGDVSLLDRVYAPAAAIAELLEHPAAWSRFIPAVEESAEHARGDGTVEYSATFAPPLVSWTGRWAMRFSPRTVEAVCVGGDLTGAHVQWDLQPTSAKETLVIYRVNMALGRGSLLVRKMFQFEPSLEHGLNTAFSLVYLRAIRAKAEGWGGSR